MFKKILIAEDRDNEKFGLVASVKEFTDANIDSSQFCDKTVLKLKEALYKKEPFDLLISDLSFDLDYKKHKITSGRELISEVKKIQPNIKIIVFSGETKSAIIKSFFETEKINAYVCKGLYGLPELKKAITTVHQDKTYTCPVATDALQQNNLVQLNAYEKKLLQLLAKGYKYDEVSDYFKNNNMSPNSKRSIEDKISKLKDSFNAKTPSQLLYLANKSGFID